MTFEIKSRKFKTTYRFFCPGGNGKEGYIWVDVSSDHSNPGTLGQQITENTPYGRSCLSARDYDEFERICRNWYRKKMVPTENG